MKIQNIGLNIICNYCVLLDYLITFMYQLIFFWSEPSHFRY